MSETTTLVDWKEKAVEARQRELAEETDLIAGTFRLRLHNVIGVEVSRGDIQVEAHPARARATVDGVTFVLEGADLYLEHACPNCLEVVISDALLTTADVGRAFTDWLPRVAEQCPHKEEEPSDPAERLLSALRDLILEYI